MSSREVWRFPVTPDPTVQHISTPGRAKLLGLGSGREGLSMWVEVDVALPDDETPYYVLGTGWTIPEGASHVDTYTTETGWVWHLYEQGDTDG